MFRRYHCVRYKPSGNWMPVVTASSPVRASAKAIRSSLHRAQRSPKLFIFKLMTRSSFIFMEYVLEL